MTPATRTIWNGAISFGLVYIPVALHSATRESGLDFDWLDKRTMDPVGYKRINKQTGEEIDKENIVKGIAYDKERYVILSDEEIKYALPKSTQVIEIESFVCGEEIPLAYFERPYYLAPLGESDKAYVLLRETLLKAKRVGIAKVVIHTKQHLAAIIPTESVLVLILLRWANQIRPTEDFSFTPLAEAGVTEREYAMADQLVQAMSESWKPEKFEDSFKNKVMTIVEEKAKADDIQTVNRSESEAENVGMADVVDFTELLRKSLQREKESQPPEDMEKTKDNF